MYPVYVQFQRACVETERQVSEVAGRTGEQLAVLKSQLKEESDEVGAHSIVDTVYFLYILCILYILYVLYCSYWQCKQWKRKSMSLY